MDYFKSKSSIDKRMVSLTLIALLSGLTLLSFLDWNLLDFPDCPSEMAQFCIVSFAMWSLTQANILWCASLGLSMLKIIQAQQYSQDQLPNSPA